jgi:hypothetical protein
MRGFLERCAVQKISTNEGESDIRLKELHRKRILTFRTSFEYYLNERGGVCSMHRNGISFGVTERRDGVEGLGVVWRRILNLI